VRAHRLGLGLLVLLLAACGGGGPGGPDAGGARPIPGAQLQPPTAATLPESPASTAAGGPSAVLPKAPEPGPALAPKGYEVKGRRDPFVPVALKPRDAGKGGIDVTTFKLVGVISGRSLLALVEGPGGIGYILKPGDVLGDGRVTDITPTSVTFAVSGEGQRATSVTLKLRTD